MAGRSKNELEKNNDLLDLPSHYIGIGASAGGLEALQTLLQNLPVNTGACFVIVQHLSPDFKSMMLELLSKHTTMHIQNVEDGVLTQRNTIYLLPPKKNMTVAKGELRLTDKIPDSGLSLPIDVFFRSLAEDQKHAAIGIILSGTGSDGSSGLKALKETGALVIAQEPNSAKFDGMPNSAINTGIVDLILRPEDIGKQLESYIQHPLVSGKFDLLKDDMESSKDVMAEIFNILRVKSDIDFSKYKPGTIGRRIERRMTIKQITSLRDYLSLLFKDTYEVKLLSKELLIGVTRFFRDEEAFRSLTSKVIPKIVSESKPNKLIRIWVAACSSGEEAYSIAMLFEEEFRKQGIARNLKVFATDINPVSIANASSGFYSNEIESDVTPNLLATYFTQIPSGGYQVNQAIRHTVVFATHNLITDPPFSNIDLVTCRNVLIYFQNSTQKRVLSSFHFALKKNAFLFLGSSENLGELAQHFTTVNERQKMFMKADEVKLPINAENSVSSSKNKSVISVPSITDVMKNYRGNSASANVLNFVNEALIAEFISPCVLLNDELEAVHVYGDLSQFIRRLPPGRISSKISDLVNDDISIAVSSAVQRAKNKGEEVFYTDVQTQNGDVSIHFNLRVRYLREHDISTSPGYFWVMFEATDSKKLSEMKAEKFDVSEQAARRIEDLELELKFNKEHLQVTIEELETTNEELQSANEELMSANEELQSTNEELQSVNEELYTVNSEFQEKIVEISQANGDLDEVLGLSKIGIIFLDENFLIRRYTEAVKDYINLQETDINRPLHHISNNIDYGDMLNDVALVFKNGVAIEKEITLETKQVLRIAINPYHYDDLSLTNGIAVTFSDISQVRYMELGMAVAYKELRSSINNALEMLDTEPLSEEIRILLIDDSAAYLELLEHQLSKVTNYKVTVFTSTNVTGALKHIQKENIDLCISDYYLQNETALDFIDELTRQNVDIPVIVVTGDAHEELTPLLLSRGALDLIVKDDLSPALLARSIRFAYRRHQIDQQIASLISESATTVEKS